MMIRPMCAPHARPAAGADAPADAFGFGAAPDALGMQNMMVLMTAPWVAFWALSHELAEETLRHAFGN